MPNLGNGAIHLEEKHGKGLFKLGPRSIDMTGALGRWLAKKRPSLPGPENGERINWPKDKSPYPGLLWFDEEYAPLFFGRNREVDDLVTKMSESAGRVLLVVGIKQGRLPGNTKPAWHRIQPSDGDTPFDALARKLKEVWKLSG